MGTSLYDQFLKEQQTPKAPPTLYDKFLAEQQAQPQGHDYHAEYKSGALQRRMQAANARDVVSANEMDAAQPSMVDQKLTNALSVGQGIPGMEAIEAGAGSLGSQLTTHPMDYRQSLQTLRDNTDQIDPKTRTAQKALGATAIMPFLPGSAAGAGAIIGGADQALNADPDMGLGERAARTVGGAALGAGTGKAVEFAGSGIRALMSNNAASQVFARQAERAKVAQRLYGAAKDEGQRRAATSTVQSFLADPDVAPIVEELQRTTHQGVPAESYDMLDALYKTFSDRAKSIGKGLEAADPSRPNTGMFRGQYMRDMKDRLLTAMGSPETQTVTRDLPPITTAQSPPPDMRSAIGNFWDRINLVHSRADGTVEQQLARQALERHGAENVVSPSLSGAPGPRTITETRQIPAMSPSYPQAVEDYAAKTGDIKAVERGNDAMRALLSKKLTSGKNLTRTTPEAFSAWASNENTPASQLAAAPEGIVGAIKEALQRAPLTMGRHAIGKAPTLLRAVNDPMQALSDLFGKGVISYGTQRLRQ